MITENIHLNEKMFCYRLKALVFDFLRGERTRHKPDIMMHSFLLKVIPPFVSLSAIKD